MDQTWRIEFAGDDGGGLCLQLDGQEADVISFVTVMLAGDRRVSQARAWAVDPAGNTTGTEIVIARPPPRRRH